MLVLASGSIARHKLLLNAAIDHKILKSGVDESIYNINEPCKLAQLLAKAKASSVYNKITKPNNNGMSDKFTAVLGCDSLLEFKGKIFGKPKNKEEAINRWLEMSSQTAILHTGHHLIFPQTKQYNEKNVCEVISTKIQFETVDLNEIKNYVSTGEPMECAGGFAIESRGSLYIKKIEGCYSNVIGISLPWLRRKYMNSKLVYKQSLN